MKKLLLLFACLLLKSAVMRSQNLYFPPITGTAWDTTAPQSLGWCQPRIDSLYNYLQLKHSKSFIILKNGKIVLEKYFGSYTADSLFYWASASKSLASFITGIAQQKSFININNLVSQYLGTGWTSETPAKENLITVKHLLQMMSGLDDAPPQPCNNEDTAKACLIYKADAGTRWAYHTGAYKKVQSVVSAAVNLNYNLITNNWVENYTGMSGLWIDQTYYSKARDMARFGLLVQNKGIWNADTLLKDSVYYNHMVNTSQSFNLSYGYLWWLNGKPTFMNPGIQLTLPGPLIPNCPADMFAALGKDDQKIYIVPSTGMVVIRQGYSADGVTFALSTFDNTLWDYINKLNCLATSMDEINSDAVSLYPNPAHDQLIVKASIPVSAIEMTNLIGCRQLIASGAQAHTLNVSALEKGVYFVKLTFENKQRLIKKIIID